MSDMRRLALHIAYQGTDFCGYNMQPGLRSVQLCLKEALQKLLGHTPTLICAGRTDAGVHAYAQLVHFDTEHSIPYERLAPALNRILPKDILALQAWELPPEFNARFSALHRHYRYVLQVGQPANPMLRHHVWQCPYELNFELFKQAWMSLLGHHHFKAFCASGSYRTQFDISVYWTHAWQYESLWVFEIIGQSFLKNMVRALIGTMSDIARGHLPIDNLQQALQTGDRQFIGTTAPPQGLYLFNVVYPAQYHLDLIQKNIHNWPVPAVDPNLKNHF